VTSEKVDEDRVVSSVESLLGQHVNECTQRKGPTDTSRRGGECTRMKKST